jgi:hypothetical protein
MIHYQNLNLLNITFIIALLEKVIMAKYVLIEGI